MLLMYRPEDDTWLELSGKLWKPQARHTAIVMDMGIFPHNGSDSTSMFTLSISGRIFAPILIAILKLASSMNNGGNIFAKKMFSMAIGQSFILTFSNSHVLT